MSKSKTPMREQKTFSFQIKEFDDAQGIVRGYLSTFDNIDETGDRVRPHAFKRTLANKYEYKKNHNTNYLFPVLWQHDTDQPIGGYLEAKEDNIGLFVEMQLDLDVQRGREAYSGLKKGYIFQQSMGYDTLQSEYVKIDGKMIRDLTEVRIWEGSIVTFPANTEAVVTSVKSASGSSDWPLGDRNTAWDGAAAHNAIVKWASQDDGSIDEGKMKSVHFWYDSAAPEKVTSYKLAFCDIVDDKPVAMPKGIFACAGSHGIEGADIPEGDVEGVKAKIAGYYSRMAKQFDDDSIKVPWSDDSSEKALGFCLDSKEIASIQSGEKDKSMQKKTLLDHWKEEMSQDLLEDWQDVYVCALTASILDALKIGDQPQADISQALDDFKTVVLEKFVAQAQEVGLSQYLQESGYSYSPADYTMQYGSESQPDNVYDYMSSSRRHARKAGRAISAANSDKIQGHADTLHGMADKMMAATKEHTKAMRSVADDLATLLQGSEAAYGTDPGKPDEGQQEGKSNHQIDLEIDKALSNLRALRA